MTRYGENLSERSQSENVAYCDAPVYSNLEKTKLGRQ